MSTNFSRRDKFIPWYFVMFFAFIALVNAVMVTLAIRTHSGVVTEHPYEKGLAYNDVVKAAEKQAALGWSSSITYKNGMLHFELRDKNNASFIPDEATAAMVRPAQQGLDFTVELNGRETPVRFPAKGQWEVRVDAVHKGVHYQQSTRIVVE